MFQERPFALLFTELMAPACDEVQRAVLWRSSSK